MDRVQMKKLAKAQVKENLLNLVLITVIVAAISYGCSLIPVAGILVPPVFTLATMIVYLKMVKGVKPEIGELFNHFDAFVPALKVNLLMVIRVVLWSLLLVIPGIVKSFAYSQAMYVLAENPGIGAREALKRSEEMMQGHKMDLFMLSLSFMGWMILSMATAGILLLWLIPYMQTVMTHFYNSIKPVNNASAYAADGFNAVDDYKFAE